MTATCKICRYYAPFTDQAMEGACRRYPPRVLAFRPSSIDADDVATFWPHVHENDSCGEFAPAKEAEPEPPA